MSETSVPRSENEGRNVQEEMSLEQRIGAAEERMKWTWRGGMRDRRDVPERQVERVSTPVKKVVTNHERPLSGQKSLVSQLRSTAVRFLRWAVRCRVRRSKKMAFSFWIPCFVIIWLMLFQILVFVKIYSCHSPSFVIFQWSPLDLFLFCIFILCLFEGMKRFFPPNSNYHFDIWAYWFYWVMRVYIDVKSRWTLLPPWILPHLYLMMRIYLGICLKISCMYRKWIWNA